MELREYQSMRGYAGMMIRLTAMCQDEDLAEKSGGLMFRLKASGWRRKPGELAEMEAAAQELGLTYSIIVDPESSKFHPTYAFMTYAKNWLLLEFMKALSF
jgi:hypothetical protein